MKTVEVNAASAIGERAGFASAAWRRVRALIVAALGASSPLVLARLISAGLTFGLPLMLARMLEPAMFGTYKQFYLVAATLLLVGQCGLTQSLYYFVPRGGAARGSYIVQAVGLLWLLATFVGIALWLGVPRLALWIGSPELAALRTPLALTTSAMIAAAAMEAALTCDGRIGVAAVSYVLSDGARAAALVAAAALGMTAFFWAATAVAIARVVVLVVLLARRVLPAAWPSRERLRSQLGFALPFAGASLLYVGQRYCSQYIVSARFDPATFAVFTVATFHLAVVDIVFAPVTEVLMVELGRTLGVDPCAALRAWDDAVAKLAALLIPAACGAWLLGPTMLPLLFTQRYAAAVPLFMLATGEILLCLLPVDALLRASGDTRFLLAFNVARMIASVALVLSGIALAGLAGAIAGALLAETAARLALLARGRRFLEVRGAANMVDWTPLACMAAAAILACAPAWLARRYAGGGIGGVTVAMLVYGISYVAMIRGRSRLLPAVRPRTHASP